MTITKVAVILVALGLALAMPGLGVILAASITSSSLGQTGTLVGLVTGALAVALGFLTFTAGVATYVFGPVFANRARLHYAAYGTILGSFFLAVLIANIIVGIYMLVESGLTLQPAGDGVPGIARGALTPSGLIVSTLVQELAVLAILYFRIVRPRAMHWQELGISGGRWPRLLGQGLLCSVAVILANGTIESVLSGLGIRQTQWQLFAVLRQGTPLRFAVMLISAGIVAAFVEELFFRGYVFGGLYRRVGALQAYLASALIFAGVHLPYWQTMPAIFVVGLIFAYTVRRAGSIVPTIIAHGLNNTVGLALIYFGMA